MDHPIQSDHPEARYHRWVTLAATQPPEALAAFVESPQARWVVVTTDGPERTRRSACLLEREDLPYWAFALAKSYLDDVGEWPLFGMYAEQGLEEYETGMLDPESAVTRILAAVKPVWPEVEVVMVGNASHQ